ncbi:MAG: hypothetical protein ABIJ48_05280 [Actinomycetota bacterium]
MARLVTLLVACCGLLAACGGDAAETSSRSWAVTTTTGSTTTVPSASTVGTAPITATTGPSTTSTTTPGSSDPAEPASYCVIDTPSWDRLSIRSGPGSEYPVVGSLAHDAVGVQGTGVGADDAAGQPWVEITGFDHGRILQEEGSSMGWAAGWLLEPEPCTRRADDPTCAVEWITPEPMTDLARRPFHALRLQYDLDADRLFVAEDERYFEARSPLFGGYELGFWYVLAHLQDDPDFRGRWIVVEVPAEHPYGNYVWVLLFASADPGRHPGAWYWFEQGSWDPPFDTEIDGLPGLYPSPGVLFDPSAQLQLLGVHAFGCLPRDEWPPVGSPPPPPWDDSQWCPSNSMRAFDTSFRDEADRIVATVTVDHFDYAGFTDWDVMRDPVEGAWVRVRWQHDGADLAADATFTGADGTVSFILEDPAPGEITFLVDQITHPACRHCGILSAGWFRLDRPASG